MTALLFEDFPPEILLKIVGYLDHNSQISLISTNKYLSNILLGEMYKNIIVGTFDIQYPEERQLTHSILKLPSYSHIKNYTIVTIAKLPKLLETLAIKHYSDKVERIILCSKDSMQCFDLLAQPDLFANLKQVRVRCSPWVTIWKKLAKEVIETPIIYKNGYFEMIDHANTNDSKNETRVWNIAGYSDSLPCVLIPSNIHFNSSTLSYLELTNSIFLYWLNKRKLSQDKSLLKVNILEFTDSLFNVSLSNVRNLIDFEYVKTLSCSVDCRSELRNLIASVSPENFMNLSELALLYSIYDGKLFNGVFPRLTKLKVDLSAHKWYSKAKELLDIEFSNPDMDNFQRLELFDQQIEKIFGDSFPELEYLEIKGFVPYFQENITNINLLCDCGECGKAKILMENFISQHCSVVDSKSGEKTTHRLSTYSLPVDSVGHWCIGECFLDCPIFSMPLEKGNKSIIQNTRLNLHLKLKNILAKNIKYKNRYTDRELNEILGSFHHKCDGVSCFKSLYTMYFHHYSLFINSFIHRFPFLKTVTISQGYIHKVVRDSDGEVLRYECVSNISLPCEIISEGKDVY